MFCKSCGKMIPDNENVCRYCGVVQHQTAKPRSTPPTYGDDKTTAGVLLCIFLGVLGLVIGLLMYKDFERETFLRAWAKTFVVLVVISIVIAIIGYSCIISVLI